MHEISWLSCDGSGNAVDWPSLNSLFSFPNFDWDVKGSSTRRYQVQILGSFWAVFTCFVVGQPSGSISHFRLILSKGLSPVLVSSFTLID